MKFIGEKGQINVSVAIIGAVGVIVSSITGAWVTVTSGVQTVDAKIGIVEEREDNHYNETVRRLDTIDDKLDQLIRQTK